MTENVMHKAAEIEFDPTEFGFLKLDYKMQSAQFFELRIDDAHSAEPNFTRLNYYLTQDGAFVTIYFGLLESWVTGARLQPLLTREIDFSTIYNEDLFRGHIRSKADANVILDAVLPSETKPQIITVTDQKLCCHVMDVEPIFIRPKVSGDSEYISIELDEQTYEFLLQSATANNRSLQDEVVFIIKKYLKQELPE